MRLIIYFLVALNGFMLGQAADVFTNQGGILYYAFERIMFGCTTDADCGCTDDCLQLAEAE